MTVEIQVTARAEVAPGEKVVGIDLGTTNSAVAAMEVLEPTRHVWTWVGVAYYINLVFVVFFGLDVSELSLTTDHLIHICFHSCTYSDKRDVLFLLVRRMLSSLADFVAGGLELLQFSGWFSNRDPERRGSTNHTQRCGLLQEWRTFGGPDCEASGQYCQHVIHDLSKELAFSQTLFEILQFSFFFIFSDSVS